MWHCAFIIGSTGREARTVLKSGTLSTACTCFCTFLSWSSFACFQCALPYSACLCSALAVLASGSGVSTEREAFMDLVKTEIERLNKEVSDRGSVSMVFHSGGVHVSVSVPLSSSILGESMQVYLCLQSAVPAMVCIASCL